MTKDRATILYVDQATSFGGSIVVLGSLVEALDKKKFRSVVVGEMSDSILKHHLQDNAKIYVIPRMFNYVLWLKLTSVIKKIHPWPLRKLLIYILSAVRSLTNTIFLVRLVRVIIKEKVDLVHVNNGMNNLEPVIAAILLGRKYIVHFHGVEKPGFIQRLLSLRVHRYIVISQYLLKALGENGYPTERMVVIPNPVQNIHALSAQSPMLREQYGFESCDKVFGIVGRIVRWKGHVEFLKSAFIVLGAVPDSKVLIVGDFSDGDMAYQERIKKMVEDSGFKNRVIMTGYVKDMGKMYSLMDVCVHASIEPEPFGLVIIEAMANGIPVIASDLGAPREIITDGVNGYLVKPELSTKLADAICNLFENVELREKIGKKGKQHVQENYQLKEYAHSVEKTYFDVLGKSVEE